MSRPSDFMGPDRHKNVNAGQMEPLVNSSTQTTSYGTIQHERNSYISVNERAPLMGRRPTHQMHGINVGVLALGVLLIAGTTIGIYLLIIQDRPYEPSHHPFDLVFRESWNAVDTIYRGNKLNSSLTQNVYIVHTGGSNCYKFEECVRIVKNMQNNSIHSSSKNDTHELPFNFLIGSDGKTYEVRGWNYEMGLDSPNLDPRSSLLIGLIGNFTYTSPNSKQLDEIKSLLGVAQRRHKLWKYYGVYFLRNETISLVDGFELITILRKSLEHYRYTIDVT